VREFATDEDRLWAFLIPGLSVIFKAGILGILRASRSE
jgi:hypothetical protein